MNKTVAKKAVNIHDGSNPNISGADADISDITPSR